MPSIRQLVTQNQELENSGRKIYSPEQSAHFPTPENLPAVVVTGLPIRGVFNPTQILDSDFTNTTQGTRTSLTMRSPVFPPQQPQSTAIASSATKISVESAVAAAQAAGKNVSIVSAQVASLSMDTIPEGLSFGKPSQTALTAFGMVNPAQSGVVAKGSLPPTGSGGFTYTSTTTSITWTWPPLIYRADGTTTTVTASPLTVTGLSASTTYNFYPYYVEATGVFGWVTDGTAVGTPPDAFTGESAAQMLQHSQAENLQGNVGLSGGPLTAATTSGGSGGGSGGGTRYCVREDMLVETRRGILPIREIVVGDELACPDIWFTEVKSAQSISQSLWIQIETELSGTLIVTPSHHITLADGSGKAAESLGLGDIIQVRYGVDSIKSLAILRETHNKIKLHCEPEHRFFAGVDSPSIVAHNVQPVS